MEWNCCWSVNNPFLFESTGDSEDVKSDVHHDHEEDEAVMDKSESQSFIKFYDGDDADVNDDDDDDAQSCSYDNHSSYVNTIYGETQYDQSQRQIYDDHEDGNIDDGDIDLSDDDMNKNWGLSKQPHRSPKFCADSSNQREIDREFWEACLAT